MLKNCIQFPRIGLPNLLLVSQMDGPKIFDIYVIWKVKKLLAIRYRLETSTFSQFGP